MPRTKTNFGTLILRSVLVASSFFFFGKFGMSMPYRLSVVTLLWLPIGIAVPAVFRWGWLLLPAVFVGPAAISLSNGQPWILALSVGATNVVGTTAIVGLLRVFDFNRFFRRRRDVITWCAACGLGGLVNPTLGPSVLSLFGFLPWSEWAQAWLLWWIGDLIGLFLAGPMLMSVNWEEMRRLARRPVEVASLVALTLVFGWFAFFFDWPASLSLFHPILLVVPLLVWAALRFGVFGASSLALGVSALAALGTSLRSGPFAGSDTGVVLFSLWAFAGMSALLSLLITALEAERTEGELTLQRQRRELLALTDNLPDLVMRLDLLRRVAFANKAVEAETGLSAAAFTGRTVGEAGLSFCAAPEWASALDRAYAAGTAQTVEFSVDGPGSNRRWVSQIVPERDERMAVQSVLIIVRDMTERYQLEVQLRQSQKLEAVGALAGGIAHDFNNILTGILGNTQMAMMDLPESSEVQEWLRRVLQASQRAKTLVNQVLAFSRRQEQNRIPVQLRTVVEEAMQLLRPSIPSSIHIATRLPDDLPRVMADSNQIHQVLLNLVTNAAHAVGDSEGRIDIWLDVADVDAEAVRQRPQLRLGRFVRLCVGDTGCGMAPAVMTRIFEPFFTTKDRGSGTGLGLSVVHGIVQQHEGCAVVTSEPGKGTTFMVYLPAIDSAAQPRGEVAIPASLPRGRGECVLVVDDEQIVLQVAVGILRRLGYVTASFMDPESALRAFMQSPTAYNLLITDLTMPTMKGTDLAARMRELRPDLPVLLCTGFRGSLALAEASKLRIAEPLLKPFTVDTLAEAVARVLRHADGSPARS